MTAVLRLRGNLARLLPWAFPVLAMVIGLYFLEVPGEAIARYGAYYVICVMLPGVLLMRALWRSTGNWAEDIGIGTAVGLGYELCGHVIVTTTGQQRYLAAWPLLVFVVFALVPRLRRHWWIANPRPLPLLWHWPIALLGGTAVIVGLGQAIGPNPVPPDGIAYYQDMLYHLSMLNEVIRQVPPQLPQVAGESLQYHWFANAHMAAGVDITGLSPALVLFRLWIVPLYVVSLLIFATLARHVSKAWWAGVVAAMLLAFSQYIDIWAVPAAFGTHPLSFLSPSQTYGVILGTAATVFVLAVMFEPRTPRRTWVLVILLAFVGGGAKPTTLPLLLGGAGLASLFILIRNRRIPWRGVLVGVVLSALTVVTIATIVGSTAGSKLRLFGSATSLAGYRATTGDTALNASAGWIIPSISSGDATAVYGAWVIVASLLFSQLNMCAPIGALFQRKLRTEPVMWFLAGTVIAGWLGYWLVDHPSGGQLYFLRSAMPCGAAACAWLLVVVLRDRSRPAKVLTLTVGTGLGAGVVLLSRLVRPQTAPGRTGAIPPYAAPMLALAVLCLVLIGLWFLLRRRLTMLAGVGSAVVIVTLLGMTLPATTGYLLRTARSDTWPVGQPGTEVGYQVHPDEQRAALWLKGHSGPKDVVASNTACRPARRMPPRCDARGYIVSAIAGRRALLEGWAYSQQALAQHGVDGRTYHVQPSPWPERAELMEKLFTAPTEELVRRLRTEYGVRWVYADLLAGELPSERLGELAVLRHAEPAVEIYELVADPPGRPEEQGAMRPVDPNR